MADSDKRTCPICKASVLRKDSEATAPFCSARCKTIDLGRWLNGSYGVDLESGRLEEIEEDAEVEEVDLDRLH